MVMHTLSMRAGAGLVGVIKFASAGVLSLCWFASAASAEALELPAGVAAGGLSFTINAGLAVKTQNVRIATDQIDVVYEFVNETGGDLATLLAFRLPRLTGVDADALDALPNSEDPINFVNASATADGGPVLARLEQRASILGLDLTDRLKADGVPLNPYPHAAGRDALAQLPKDKRDFYLKHGLAQWVEGQPISVQWDVETVYSWIQSFPAGKPVRIALRYAPVGVAALISASDVAAPDYGGLRKTFCLSDRAVGEIDKVAKYGDKEKAAVQFLSSRIDYALFSAIGWAQPIENFVLTIVKPRSGTAVGVCAPGAEVAENVEQTRLAWKNFAPRTDLAVLFVNVPVAE